MDDNKFFIDYPSDLDMKQEIHTIIEKGLPKKKSFYCLLKEIHQQLGWKYLFRDYLELSFVGILFILYMVSFGFYFYTDIRWDASHLYAYLFISSPLLYGAVAITSLIGKRDTYELEMVCKYNIYQVSAYRMLVFSFVSILMNVIQIGIFSIILKEINTMTAIMISLTSLFIFSIGSLYITTRIQSPIIQKIIIGGWIFINIGIAVWNSIFYQYVLMNIPYAVYCFVIIAAGYLYVRNIKYLALGAKGV